jgi:F-type H+-transporting ATPase subunit delta
MAEPLTIARPYAEAAYELAKQHNALQAWLEMLSVAANVSDNEKVQAYIDNPKVGSKQKEDLFFSILGQKANDAGKNFIRLLLANDRVKVLPQVYELFKQLKSEQEGTLTAKVSSAFPLTDAQTKELVENLQARFKRKIEIQVGIDKELIGGVKVEVGDEVIDASVRGKLQAMALTLKR